MNNQKTEKLLESFIKRPSSSLILATDRNTEAVEIVHRFCDELLDISSRFDFIELEPEDKKSITVEQVRELNKSLNNLVRSSKDIARIAIIWDAQYATTEAQNALLKLIEEPTNQTLLILQVGNMQSLLPTISSRCQVIPVLPLSRKQTLELANLHDKDEKEAEIAYLITGGDSSMLKKYFDTKNADSDNSLQKAKEFLNNDPSLRLSMQKEFDTSEKLKELISNIQKIASVGLRTSKSTKAMARMKDILVESRKCTDLLNRNANLKLIFTRLCIGL